MTMEILATADTAVCDRFALDSGIEVQSLVEAAGSAVADAIRTRWAPRLVWVLAGSGHNGADGLVTARVLREAGWPVRVILLPSPDRLAAGAERALARWAGPVDPPDTALSDTPDGRPGLVVDALFGAGLSRPITGLAAGWIDWVRESEVPVVAVDIPSGLSGDARPVDGPHFAATLTVTFHRKKLVHLIEPYAQSCGEVVRREIGIPAGWSEHVAPVAHEVHTPLWHPDTRPDGRPFHKHARGRVAVFSGGARSSGAARLAAAAALRAGAGVVTLCAPPSAVMVNASHLTAVMLTRWDGAADVGDTLDGLRADAVVMGPSMGVGEPARDAVLAALETGIPVVLDADALTSFEHDPDALFSQLNGQCVLTPHAGEFLRVFGPAQAHWNKVERVQAAADRCGSTVLLKGPATVIATPGMTPWINPHASRWLATAGSGDVLAGIIASGLAAGMTAHDAAASAAWIHGDAGLKLGEGLVAEDLPATLPAVLQGLAARRRQGAALSHLLAHGS
ncbi:NAD(P)H-hydrate dehydratase [Maricaulis sp.]|uniref:NAD(P)H-hydrate dehydratase n=1 Tax=Maricaulis sp. TaxID=1486257 RepID=UPI002B2689C8|nr:NAD(P)H-hydrate dehydratase [Maricaulis sp.]